MKSPNPEMVNNLIMIIVVCSSSSSSSSNLGCKCVQLYARPIRT